MLLPEIPLEAEREAEIHGSPHPSALHPLSRARNQAESMEREPEKCRLLGQFLGIASRAEERQGFLNPNL